MVLACLQSLVSISNRRVNRCMGGLRPFRRGLYVTERAILKTWKLRTSIIMFQ